MLIKNNLKKSRLTLALLAGITLLSACGEQPTPAVKVAEMTSIQVVKDITYLASDSLKGRASFSPEIDQAADYISQRFTEIGLIPLDGSKDFKQTFKVTSIMPSSLTVTLNGNAIEADQLGMASTIATLAWNSAEDVNTHIIGETDDMRAALGKMNNEGGQHFVIIHSAHAKTFAGYQGYFKRGLTKLSLKHKGAIVMVLADDNEITSLAVNATTSITEKTLTNIVAILPGKDKNLEKAKEVVLYSSHYDHLGLSADGKEVFNGADDDASGTSAVINLAQHYASQGNNKRTLMFSAFTAEEIGGFGSKYFSQQLNPDDVVAMINIEMIGKPSKFGAGTMWMTGMERSNLGELLNASLQEKNTEVYKDPYPEQGLFYRSDNATLARLGVPAHSFSSTQLDKDQHYHQTSDDINSLDLDSMYKVIESLSVATQGLVDGSITPTRIDVSTVRASGKIY
jgi:aminopeptidase YwaD